MGPLTASTISLIVSLLPQVIQLWNATSGNSLQKIADFLKGAVTGGEVQEIEAWAAAQFPQVGQDLQAASAFLMLAHQHAGVIFWLQDVLNLAQSLHLITFAGTGPAGGNTPLVVDGKFGPRTKGALMALQAKLHLPTTGVLADEESAVLSAISANGLAGAVQFIFQGILSKITGK